MRDILFDKVRNDIIPKIGNEDWITIYLEEKSDEYIYHNYAFLIPENAQLSVLQYETWGFDITSGIPSTMRYSDKEDKYSRFNNDEGYEPIITQLFYNNIIPSQIELSEEFRHYFNLYFNPKTKYFIRIDEESEETEIVYFSENHIKIKTRYLKEFLAVKNMSLVVCFDYFHFYKTSLEVFDIKHHQFELKLDDCTFLVNFQDEGVVSQEGCNSRLVGKKIVNGLKDFVSKDWSEKRKNQKYVEFLIDTLENGEEESFSCNPDGLGNLFGGNPDSPQFLTPIFFKREVLQKYYQDTRKYSVKDNEIEFKGVINLQIDNNHEKYIIVYLGDLGRTLNYKEQQYWRSFNVVPDEGMSSVKYSRDILNRFAEPIAPDLVFKKVFKGFQRDWFNQYQYHLFKPLNEEDFHYFETLRIPLQDSLTEFESQVLAITKILIDSINEAQIEKEYPEIKDAEVKGGIKKLEWFLLQKGFIDNDGHILYLQKLQGLRSSSVAHRKGKEYQRSVKNFKIDELSKVDIFREILTDCASFIKVLRVKFLRNKSLSLISPHLLLDIDE